MLVVPVSRSILVTKFVRGGHDTGPLRGVLQHSPTRATVTATS